MNQGGNNQLSILYTTIATRQDAENLANKAVAEKIAACVNIIPGGVSVYVLDGRIEQGDECYMIFKTTAELLPTLEQWIIENHPYDLPAILKFDVGASSEFLAYITGSVKIRRNYNQKPNWQ